MTALDASRAPTAAIAGPISANRLGALAVAIGAAGVVVTSIFYGLSPLAAAMPLIPLDLAAAADGALGGAAAMHRAGTVGVFGDMLITVGGLLLGVERAARGQSVAASGWFLIAISTVLFSLVDAMVGFVLPAVAVGGASPAFLAAKSLFDILFMLGTATFGLGATLAVAGDAFARHRTIPRMLALPALLVGLAAFVGGAGGILGLNLHDLMALGILGGSAIFVLVGLRLASASEPA